VEELRIEVAMSIGTQPSGGLELTLYARSRGTSRQVARWVPGGRSISSGELEDACSAMVKEVMEHIMVGPGVQLAFHD
jgi:hypothetical protein